LARTISAPQSKKRSALAVSPARDIASAMKLPSRNQQYSRYGPNVGAAEYAPDGAWPAAITSIERA
jgi:hypothetical protein